MSQQPSEADELQRAMREVRVELRADMRELVGSAREMTDWRSYVRAYPWVCVGAALVAGYLLVPKRTQIIHTDLNDVVEMASKKNVTVQMDERRPKHGSSMAMGILEMATTSLIQAGVMALANHLTQVLERGNQPPPSPQQPGATP